MTLIVARQSGKQIAIASDTLLSEHGKALSFREGVIKSCALPGDICVSFSNSPELAQRDFDIFQRKHPRGRNFSQTIEFFEGSSKSTGNDYLVAFGRQPKIVRIKDGKRDRTSAKTLWIGEKRAYERFREYQAKKRSAPEAGRAIRAVLFADELTGSPASDLQSTMRQVVADSTLVSVGGFVHIVSNRGSHFRPSVYADMFFDWPRGKSAQFELKYADRIDLAASGENIGTTLAQISPDILNFNMVAYYVLAGRLLYLFHGDGNCIANKCQVFADVEPDKIEQRLESFVGSSVKWLAHVHSAAIPLPELSYGNDRQEPLGNEGIGFKIWGLYTCLPKPEFMRI